MVQTKVARVSTYALGEKLRRLARQAEVSNLVTNLPWALPPAWASGQAIVKGNVRSSAGSWAQAVSNGTTAGASLAADTGVTWQNIGGPTITANDPEAPVVTVTAANAPTYTPPIAAFPGLTGIWQWIAHPGAFRAYGGTLTSYAGTLGQMSVFNAAAGTPGHVASRIAFYCDDPTVAFAFSNAEQFQPVRPSIDRRYYSPDGHVVNGTTTPTFVVYDFSGVAARKPRLFTVDFTANTIPAWWGVICSPNGTVWAPPTVDDVRSVWISDSLIAGSGYGPFMAGNYLSTLVSDLLGWSDTWCMSTGGTGYVATNGGTAYTYGQRISQALALNPLPDIWVLFGSTNDSGQSGVTAAVTAAMQQIRAGGSAAPIIVFGVHSVSGAAAVETQVQAGVSAAADPLGLTFFIPISNDPVWPWISGSWNNSGNNSLANSAIYVSADLIHPPQVGTNFYAQRMARAIKTSVLPFL